MFMGDWAVEGNSGIFLGVKQNTSWKDQPVKMSNCGGRPSWKWGKMENSSNLKPVDCGNHLKTNLWEMSTKAVKDEKASTKWGKCRKDVTSCRLCLCSINAEMWSPSEVLGPKSKLCHRQPPASDNTLPIALFQPISLGLNYFLHFSHHSNLPALGVTPCEVQGPKSNLYHR